MGLLDAISPIVKSGKTGKTEGAFSACNDEQKKTKFEDKIAAAYNGATGYVSPPSTNIMGFGPASKSGDQTA